jgi:hypothetical protein
VDESKPLPRSAFISSERGPGHAVFTLGAAASPPGNGPVGCSQGRAFKPGER